MAGLFGYDSLFDLKVELEQIKETLKGENGLALLKELQTELLFRWMIFDDAMSDQILGISENQYVQVLTGSDAVDHFVLSRLSPTACPADLESSLVDMNNKLKEYDFPAFHRPQLTPKELKILFEQLENTLGFCSRFLKEKLLPILRLDAIRQGAEVEFTVRERDNAQNDYELILYHQSEEKPIQRCSVLYGLGHLLCYHLTGRPDTPPNSFRALEHSLYGNLAFESEERMRRFLSCFAWTGAQLVEKTYRFPIGDVPNPDFKQLFSYFRSL